MKRLVKERVTDMAFYKSCLQSDEPRCEDYRFSVESTNDKDLLKIKEDISKRNKRIRSYIREVAEYDKDRALKLLKRPDGYRISRVRLMPRGHRVGPAMKDFGYPRAYDSYLPKKYASYFDVYVGPDTHAEYMFRDQIENNLTPGEQAEINRIQKEIWEKEGIIRAIKYRKKS